LQGVGVEELFYNGDFLPDDYRLDMLQTIKNGAKVLVSEYVNDDNNIGDALTRSQNEGFLCFVRDSSNYDYKEIPATVPNENTNNITSLIEAQNHLYLIGADFPTKQDMISAIAATNFDIVLIDLFFGDTAFTAAEIAQLKIKNNGAQRLVISYINVGAAEKYRYYWQDGWSLGNPKWLKKHYDGYPDEFWVEYWHKEWKDIIFGNNDSYMKKIIDAGFDGAYLDNVEAYYFLYHD
jgi:cysteinyl-tRNA synthetase